jgi:penicillin V acylase-like amidase (Ntn superfamily)
MYKLFFVMVLLFFARVDACTTFLIKRDSQVFVAKSYDWIAEDGLVVVNKRHIAKQAMTLDQPMRWVSRYGSVIFTQVGRELPMGGMNETGLVIEQMWLEGTTYPSPDCRAAINELQWIQYQLDTACCLEEVIASDRFLRIDKDSKSLLHFLVVDRNGRCAYKESLEFLKKHHGFGGELIAAPSFESLDRFVCIATQLKAFSLSSQRPDVSAAFKILHSVVRFEEIADEVTEDNVEELMRSQWNIVYDVSTREIHFLTAQHQRIRTIRINSFDYVGSSPVDILDMQAKLEGDVHGDFIPYTYGMNRRLIGLSYDKIPFLRAISEEIRDWVARYPETTVYRK